MSIIESDKIDIEIQEQTDPDAGCKYLILVSFEGPNQSKEIAKVLMTNNKPHLRQTVDEGDIVVEKVLHQSSKETPDLKAYIQAKVTDVKNN